MSIILPLIQATFARLDKGLSEKVVRSVSSQVNLQFLVLSVLGNALNSPWQVVGISSGRDVDVVDEDEIGLRVHIHSGVGGVCNTSVVWQSAYARAGFVSDRLRTEQRSDSVV